MIDDSNLDVILLNYALRNKKYMLEISKAAKSAYFDPRFQEFFAIIHGVFLDPTIKEVLSLPALMNYCDRNNLSSRKDYLQKVYNGVQSFKLSGQPPADSDFTYYLKCLKNRRAFQVIKSTLVDLSQSIDSSVALPQLGQILETSVSELHNINSGEVFDEGTIGADIENIYQEYQHIAKEPDQFKGVSSGYPSLDNLTNGFFGGELIIIAGFEGTGKSVLSMNMAINAWMGSNKIEQNGPFSDDGANVIYFSLEMPRSNRGEFTSGAYLNKRVVSCVGGIPFSSLRKGILADDEELRFKETCDFIKKYEEVKKFYVVDIPRGATIQDIESKYLEVKNKFPVDLIVIDYMGLMAGAENEEDADWESQGKIAAGLHEFARMNKVPVISPVQVNRPSGTNHSLNKQSYNTTRIARSAMITQNANIVIQIGCRDQEENYSDMPIYIIKMRDAPKATLSFNKDFGKMRILDSTTSSVDNDLSEFENIINGTSD